MCNLSKGVLEKGLREGMEKGMKEGMKQGLEKGMEQGLEKGMEQGLEKGTLQAIKNLMETLSFTFQQAMDALKIPEIERAQYEKLLNE